MSLPQGYPQILMERSFHDEVDAEIVEGVAVESGRLCLSASPDLGSPRGHPLVEPPLADVVFDAQLSLVEGGPADAFGVYVRQANPDRYVAWTVNTARVARVGFVDGGYTPTIDGPLTDEVPFAAEVGAVNRFTVVCVGPMLTFVLNGHTVTGVMTDARYLEGHAGVFLIHGGEDEPSKLATDWVQVRQVLVGQPDHNG